jgi:hypothetical protein
MKVFYPIDPRLCDYVLGRFDRLLQRGVEETLSTPLSIAKLYSEGRRR